MGITCLVVLLGRDARPAKQAADDLLWSPTVERLEPLADETAGWPLEEGGIGVQLVRVIAGMTIQQRSSRTSLKGSLTKLESYAGEANLRQGAFDSTEDSRASQQRMRECIVCMSEPRSIRFACGHLACCNGCTDMLQAAAIQEGRGRQAKCPICQVDIDRKSVV